MSVKMYKKVAIATRNFYSMKELQEDMTMCGRLGFAVDVEQHERPRAELTLYREPMFKLTISEWEEVDESETERDVDQHGRTQQSET